MSAPWLAPPGAPSRSLFASESPIFERYRPRYLVDDEFARLQIALRANPQRGDVIPGSGGIRKLRWRRRGIGKRGGVRVIYYVSRPHVIWLLTIYAKGEVGSIPAHLLRAIKQEMEDG